MTSAISPTHRSIVALNLPLTVAPLIVYGLGIVKGMTGNPVFPNPTPTLATVSTAVTALSTAQTATLTRTKGAVAARNAAHANLRTLLMQLRNYVQSVADADPENAASIIQGAGMAVRKTAVRAPRVFAAAPGPVAGAAKLVAPSAGHRASYEWEYSPDGGKTWAAAPPTLQAKTILVGLPSGTVVQFRYRAVTKAGAGDWSVVVSASVK